MKESSVFLLNSFDVLKVQFAPALIRALVIILPEVNPSQSICVVTIIDFFDLIQSEILSLKSESDSSNDFIHYSSWATTDLYFQVLGILSIFL